MVRSRPYKLHDDAGARVGPHAARAIALGATLLFAGCPSLSDPFGLQVKLVSPQGQSPLSTVDVLQMDVEYEDGTVFTIKAKEVKSQKVAEKAAKKKSKIEAERASAFGFDKQKLFGSYKIDTSRIAKAGEGGLKSKFTSAGLSTKFG